MAETPPTQGSRRSDPLADSRESDSLALRLCSGPPEIITSQMGRSAKNRSAHNREYQRSPITHISGELWEGRRVPHNAGIVTGSVSRFLANFWLVGRVGAVVFRLSTCV